MLRPRVRFDRELQLEPCEPEVAIGALAAGTGGVDLEVAVGEAVALREAGEGDSEAGGVSRNQEVLGAPGRWIGAPEYRRWRDFDRLFAFDLGGTRRPPIHSIVSGNWNSLVRTVCLFSVAVAISGHSLRG